MRVVVTGGTGQLASCLVERGAGKAEIVLLGRPEFELTDAQSVLREITKARGDVIINTAGHTAVDDAEHEPELAMRINSDGAGFVAQAARALNAPLLHISTDYVFDGASQQRYREHDPAHPINQYGRSKLSGEKKVLDIWPNSVVMRSAWAFSQYGSNFVRTMLRIGESQNQIEVVADQRGDPTAALDIADALLNAAERLVADPASNLRGIFHMTAGGCASWAELAEATFGEAELLGHAHVSVTPIATAQYPRSARRPAFACLDSSKLQDLYGIQLPQWRESLAETVKRLLG